MNNEHPNGVLYLAKEGTQVLEEHHFDGAECFCSICINKNKFVPNRIVVPN